VEVKFKKFVPTKTANDPNLKKRLKIKHTQNKRIKSAMYKSEGFLDERKNASPM
jgi:hypothetical protein